MKDTSGRIWVAVILGIVGLVVGASGGAVVALVVGGLAAWFGWHIARPAAVPLPERDAPPAEPASETISRFIAQAPPRKAEPAPDDDLAVITDFVDDALAAGLIDPPTHRRLLAEVAARRTPITELVPLAPVAPPPPRPAPPPVRPAAAAPPPAPFPEVPAPAPREPAAVAAPPPPTWTSTALDGVRSVARQAWSSLVSDVAVHGLAYLGVLFVFVATLGFVLVAFSGVGSAWRPVAEAAIPTVLFGAAWFLRSRGAPYVSASLELLAGAVTPVVAFAAFADEAAFPPDLERGPLVATLASVALGLAAAYSWAAARRPQSPLRYLAAPMVWLAVGTLGLVLEEGASAAQFALVAWAIVATSAAARWRPDGRLAAPALAVAAPGLVVAYGLAVLLAGTGGWPPVPILAAGGAVVAAAEVLHDRLRMPWAIQAAAAGVTAGAAAAAWPAGWVAVAAVLAYLGLAELWLARGAEPAATVVLLGAAGAGVLAAALGPGPLLAASAAGTAWAHARRIKPQSPLVARIAAGAACVLPLGAAGALAALTSPSWVIAGTAALAAAVAALRLVRTDPLLEWWAAGYGGLALAATVWAAAAGESPAVLAGAAALGGLAIALLPRFPAARTWAAAGGWLWALALTLDAAELPTEWWPASYAAAGAAAVGASFAGRRQIAVHVAVIGHGALAASLATAFAATPRLVVLTLWTAAWIGETAAAETGRSAVVAALRGLVPTRLQHAAGGLPAVVAAASVPFLVAAAADWSGLLEGERGRMGLALAALAMAYGAAARVVPGRRPLAPILAGAGFTLAAVAIAVAAPEPWPTMVTTATPAVVVALLGRELRRPSMLWLSWAVSAVLAILLAEQLGVAPRHLHLVVLGWGATLTLGGLVLDDARRGRRRPGEGLRLAGAAPPVVLGAVAVPVGLAYTFAGAPGGWWPWALAGAAFYLAVAVVLRAGSVSAASYALGTLALGAALAGTGFDLITERPALLAPAAAALVGVAAVLDRLTSERDPLLGWSAAPFVVAHGVAAVGLVAALDVQFPLTAASFGGLAIAVAAWKRHPGWAVAGDALVLAGAAAAGPGWLALALAGNAAALVAAAAVVPQSTLRVGMQWAAPAFAGAAWVAAIEWGAWWPDPALPIGTLGAGGLALTLALAYRLRILGPSWVMPWGTLAAAATVAAAPALVDTTNPIGLANSAGPALWLAAMLVVSGATTGWTRLAIESAAAGFAGWAWTGTSWWAGWWPEPAASATIVASGAVALAAALAIRSAGLSVVRAVPWLVLGGVTALTAAGATIDAGSEPLGFTLAGSLAMWSLASGLAARPADPMLRYAAVVLAAGAAGSLAWGAAAPPTAVVIASACAGIVLTMASLAIWGARPDSLWLGPGALAAVVANAAALAAATQPLPDRDLLIGSLAAAALQALAAALMTRRAGYAYAGLPMLTASFLLFATEALGGEPHWYTVPIGVTVVALVDVARWDRHRRGLDTTPDEVIFGDLLGMAFVVGAALVQTVTAATTYGLLGMLLGAAVVAYGAATRVRRRCYFGAGATVLAALAMVVVPLAGVVPQFRGLALWASMAAIGTTLILVATYLEQGRARVAAGVRRLEEIMGGWE